ncbi:MAG: glycosyltransferase [Thermoanaerobaculia bacterium]
MIPDLFLRAWSFSWPWSGAWIGTAAWAGALLVLAYPLLAAAVHRRRLRAPRLAGRPSDASAPATVLLPLRDEEADAEPCIRSLLGQNAGPRLVAIDDGSTDRTPEVLAALARESGRLQVVSAGPLPPGWRGKVHALEAGRRALAGASGRAAAPSGDPEWLLLTDADTRHHPDLLARAVATAEGLGLGLLSVAGRQRAEGPGENLVVPGVFALLDALVGDWRRAIGGELTLANGQFILVRSTVLERIGGFGAIRFAALDDLALARAVQACGERTGFVRAPDLLEVRMYRGLRSALAGWRRTLGGIFGDRPGRAGALLAALLAPPAVLALGAATMPAAAFVAWGCAAGASALFRLGTGNRVAWALLSPLDFLAVAYCLGGGVTDHRRGRLAPWKGRAMPLSP